WNSSGVTSLAICGSRPKVTNSVRPMPKPPRARAKIAMRFWLRCTRPNLAMALRNIFRAMTTRGGADLIGRRSEVLVLDAARRGEEGDRASLAARTELTPQAVSNVLTRLTDAGLVETAGPRSSGVGKPATVYRMRDAA